MRQEKSIILGINCAHDAATCILVDGEIRMAVPEERLSRIKHYVGFPKLGVKLCLESAGLSRLEDATCIVLNESAFTDFGLKVAHSGYPGLLLRNPSHHLLHAYYAWVASGFDDAAILIVDGSGFSYGEHLRRKSPLLGRAPEFSEMEEAESQYVGRRDSLALIDKRWGLWESCQPYYRFPSLGHMFSMASQYIFGHWIHAGKSMGLAPYGDATALPGEIVTCTEQGISVNTRWIDDLPPRSGEAAHLDKTCRDLAAKVQSEIEKAMLHLAHGLYRKASSPNLCLCGGVALNSVVNGRLLREAPFDDVYIPPAANDTGIAIGAALYGYHQLTGTLPRWQYTHDFHGREYTNAEVSEVVSSNNCVNTTRPRDPAESAASDIAAGKVIAWFEGASEFGPRALGHRSILCDARDADIKNRLNSTVKFRECFRPYAASILSEHSSDFFELDRDSPYMLFVARVRACKLDLIPGVCHVDGTCRVQTVSSGYVGAYRRLIECFMSLTSVPMVLNTSLNVRGEPIVETPADAVRCFLATNIDVLYLNGLRITKIVLNKHRENGRLVPVLNEGLTMKDEATSVGGKWIPEAVHVQTRTGYKMTIDPIDRDVLRAVDGVRTAEEIRDTLSGEILVSVVINRLERFQTQGLVSFFIPEKRFS